MKITQYYKLLFILITVSLGSCTSETIREEDSSSMDLVVTSSKSRVFENTRVDFKAVNSNGVDVTGNATFSINGTNISGSSYDLIDVGTYTVTASTANASSNELSLDVVEPSYTTKMLVEDFTGTWCGWCPKVLKTVEEIAGNSNIIVIGIHQRDQMEFRFEAQMRAAFGIQGLPAGVLNRDAMWVEVTGQKMDKQQLNPYLNAAVGAGLSISSTVNGNDISTNVNVGYDIDLENTKLIVFALDNGVIEDQTNYTDHYNAVDYIVDYEHLHILKANLSELTGDPVPADQQKGGTIYSKSYSYTATGVSNVMNMEIVAILVDADDKVINVQKAAVGTTKDFD
jgi:thiol-disulfide isomerase/thioredoxin